ncbi:hypothetical protein IPM09_03790 [Candidatus Saccharibacteria bacterium]|nr:MAG: hypothetical protein IPM09_03790 [Candidatus Saccharibacteria bacterium]
MTDEAIIEKLKLGTHDPDILALSIAQARELIEMRVSHLLERTMTDEQRNEFTAIKDGPQETVVAWIEREFGDIDNLRQTVFEDLADELAADASRDSSY